MFQANSLTVSACVCKSRKAGSIGALCLADSFLYQRGDAESKGQYYLGVPSSPEMTGVPWRAERIRYYLA
jgi:hypothetical protein